MRATVAFNHRLSSAYRHLGLATPGFPATFHAGQFVMVRPAVADAPFLPRAFSLYRLGAAGQAPVIEILYKVVGTGTQCLAEVRVGAAVEVLGPLGNHFSSPRDGEITVLVAGGIGVPPIAARATQCGMPAHAERGMPSNAECGMRNAEWKDPASARLHVFLGGRTSEDILCVKDFEATGADVRITTEDGSVGVRGLITDLLEPFLAARREPKRPRTSDLGPPTSDLGPPTSDLRPVAISTCGPPGMLRAVAELAAKYGVPCQVSMEAAMACGFGACMGCNVETHGHGPGPTYRLVCKDGPVFDAREIKWSAQACVPGAWRPTPEGPRA
jgi:dihydroorotate dehydrogenase electron transfer subunit